MGRNETLIKHVLVNGWEVSARGEPAERYGDSQPLMNVVFPDAQGKLAALGSAQTLARDLGARIRVLAPHAVPFGSSLDNPPVAIGFLETLLIALVSGEAPAPTETAVHLYLCRDRLVTLGQVLEPTKRRRTLASTLDSTVRHRLHQVTRVQECFSDRHGTNFPPHSSGMNVCHEAR